MAITLGAFEAKTRLSELLALVEGGEEVTSTKHGRPVARLVPMADAPGRRDWAEFWRRVDERRVRFPSRDSIKEAIEEGRA